VPARPQRVSVLDDVGDQNAPAGTRPWAVWYVGQAQLQRDELDRDATCLREMIGNLQKYEAWKVLGVPSFDMLCTTRLRLTSEEVDAVLAAKKGQPLGAVLRPRGAPKGNKNAAKDKPEENKPDNVRIEGYGNQTDYLAARLRRDHPEVEFDEAVRGSVRAAAKSVGIVKPPDRLKSLQRAWTMASVLERARFLEWIE
jgi:hypothetical protein